MPRFSDPERLLPDHVLTGFDCGVKSLEVWLERHARLASGANSARTYVITDSEARRVVGYHALAVGSITHHEATGRAAKGMPKHAIPVVLLARLAVDRSVRGRGLGAFLLRDAMVRALAVSKEAAARLLLAHALGNDARAFYERFGFEASPTDPMNMQLLMKDIEASIRRTRPRPPGPGGRAG